MNSRTVTFLVLLVLMGGQCLAGPVTNLFGREILGMPWTASRTDIAQALPGGKWADNGLPQTYTVADSSSVFHVARTISQTIVVALNAAGKIDAVTIDFPNGTETHLDLLENLTEYLGEPSPADTSVVKDAVGKTNVRTIWEENGLRVTLLHTIVTTTFTSNAVTVARVPAL